MKFKIGDKIKIIKPEHHPYKDKVGIIVTVDDKAKSNLFYVVEFSDKKRHWFGDEEIMRESSSG